MAYVLTDESNYEDIADAIREKAGTSATYKPSEMAAAVRAIETGGDVTGVKGDAESTYRTGDVNITPENIGAKALQASVASPSASGVAIEFIDTINQDAQGVITPTKKTVREATASQSGLMSGTDKSRLDSIRSSMLKELKYYLDLPYPIKTGTYAKMEEYPDPNIGCAKIDILTAEDNTPDKWVFGKTPYYAYVANTQMELDDLDARATAAETDITALQSALAASEAKRMAMYPTGTISGPVAAFPDGAEDVPVKALTVDISPVQTGSGDPSPSNVRPISGWTGATIRRTGKNLLPLTVEGIKAANTSGTWDGNAYTVTGVTHTILTDADGNVIGIRVSGSPTGSRTLFKLCDHTAEFATILSGCPVGGSANSYELQFNGTKRDFGSGASIAGDGTTGSVYIIIRPGYTASDLVFTPMIRAASVEDSTFEPYYGTTYSVTLPSEAGTVYGGTLDVTNGVLTVDIEYIPLPVISGTAVSGDVRRWYTYANFANLSVVCCDSLIASDDRKASNVGYVYLDSGRICVTPSWAQEITTVSEFNAALAEHPINIVLTTTPVSYQLDPVEVRTLLGANTIYADHGDVSVTYRADPTLQHDNLDGGDVRYIPNLGVYGNNTVGKALRDMEDTIFNMNIDIGSLQGAILGDKLLVFNQDGTVSWEEAPA